MHTLRLRNPTTGKKEKGKRFEKKKMKETDASRAANTHTQRGRSSCANVYTKEKRVSEAERERERERFSPCRRDVLLSDTSRVGERALVTLLFACSFLCRRQRPLQAAFKTLSLSASISPSSPLALSPLLSRRGLPSSCGRAYFLYFRTSSAEACSWKS